MISSLQQLHSAARQSVTFYQTSKLPFREHRSAFDFSLTRMYHEKTSLLGGKMAGEKRSSMQRQRM